MRRKQSRDAQERRQLQLQLKAAVHQSRRLDFAIAQEYKQQISSSPSRTRAYQAAVSSTCSEAVL